MNVAFQRNIGSFLRAFPGLAASSVTAGGAGDATDKNGITLDRNVITPLALSGAFILQVNITGLTDAKTATVTCKFQDSADGSNWDDYDAGPPDAGSHVLTEEGDRAVQFNCQLGGARRYVRAVPKIDMSASGTDATSVLGGVWVVGGFDELPADVTAAAEGISA